jgi:gliding motility-associated-like protein
MKKIITLLVIFFALISNSNASHVAGCDLTYQCLGGNTYQITLSFYRDCSGVTADASSTVNFTSSCGSSSVTLSQISGSGAEITSTCPGQTTSCSGGSLYGLQEYIYQGQVTLSPCADWTMSYTMCCRNPSNTISAPESADIYIPATLNNVAAPCNSSPTFSNPPSTIICLGQSFCYNHGAVDPDGDSLSYSFVTPYDDGPSGSVPNVSYLAGYSALQPLPSSPAVTIDPVTGDICMTPTQNITTVFSVLVQEWRDVNGVPTCVGSVLRDMQLTVISCTNQLPTLAGINPAATAWSAADSVYKWYMCAGETLDFSIFSHDANNPPENLEITWNSGIPGGTWSVTNNNTPAAVGQFSWTPGIADVSNAPHCFTVTVKDNHCPYVGLQAFSYCVYVTGVGVVLEPPNDTTICSGQPYTITAHPDTSVTSLIWSINGTAVTPQNDTTLVLNTSTLAPGVYTVSVVANGGIASCSGGNSVNITVGPNLNLSITPVNPSLCNGDSVTLTVNGGGAATYTWSPPAGLDTVGGPSVVASPLVATTYTVNGVNGSGCNGTATVTVGIGSNLTLSVTPPNPEICTGGFINLTASGAINFSWSPPNGLSSTVGSSVNASPGATTTYTVNGNNNNSCTGSTTVTVIVGGMPEINFSAFPLSGCAPLRVDFTDATTPIPDTWNWDFGDPQTNLMNHSTAQNPIHIFQYPGSYGITLNVSGMGGCSGSLYIPNMINVYQNPIANFVASPEIASELEPTIMFYDQSILAENWFWNFGDYASINNQSDLQNPSYTYTDTGKYNVTLVVGSQHGCYDTVSKQIYIDPNVSFYIPNVFTPNMDGKNEVFICKGEGINNNTFNLILFNRWGSQIFQSSDITTGWNGEYNGKPAETGVYTYMVTFYDIKGKFHKLKGVVTLYR